MHGHTLRGQVDVDAERTEHVGGAGARRQRAVAVFGDLEAARGHDKRGAVEMLSVPSPSPPVPHVDRVRRRLVTAIVRASPSPRR